MIAESEIEKAVTYLRESAADAAQARATVKYLAEFLKSKVATIAVAQTDKSAAAADQLAKSHPEYLELLKTYRDAVEQDAFHGFKREAADAMIRAWQTMSSNARIEGRVYG